VLSQEIDNVYNKDTSKIELYLQNDKNGLINRVINFDNFLESFYASYNIIRNELGNVIYIAEFPYSESGDWDLAYENYFDNNGNLIVFIRKCSFFNGICAEIVNEKSEYFYDLNHELIKKTYEITDENKKTLDYKKCVFNYQHDYMQYLTLEEYLTKKKFEK
jgi:hypothetical protein